MHCVGIGIVLALCVAPTICVVLALHFVLCFVLHGGVAKLWLVCGSIANQMLDDLVFDFNILSSDFFVHYKFPEKFSSVGHCWNMM